MFKLFTSLGSWLTKAISPFFKNVPPSQAIGLVGGGFTLSGLWDGITGIFQDTADQGTVTEENEDTIWEQFQNALRSVSVATATAGALFIALIVVLGYKSFKKAMK